VTVNFNDPFGLMDCKNSTDPKCKKGVVITFSLSASAAMRKIANLGGNVEAGYAVNLTNFQMIAYAHSGGSFGQGASLSGEAAIVFNQSLDDVAGHSGNPARNALETEFGGGVSGNLVSEKIAQPLSSAVGGGVSAGPGGGLMFNTTSFAASTPAFSLKDVLKAGIRSTVCLLGRTTC
jgi:hypothetical protein